MAEYSDASARRRDMALQLLMQAEALHQQTIEAAQDSIDDFKPPLHSTTAEPPPPDLRAASVRELNLTVLAEENEALARRVRSVKAQLNATKAGRPRSRAASHHQHELEHQHQHAAPAPAEGESAAVNAPVEEEVVKMRAKLTDAKADLARWRIRQRALLGVTSALAPHHGRLTESSTKAEVHGPLTTIANSATSWRSRRLAP